MKNTIIPLFTFTLFLHLSLSAALPERWDVELTAQPPQVFTLQRPRGETYELEAVLKNRGKPFEPAITNACIYWQTNGMENLYWSAPASVSNNFLRASWLPSMDPGATTVRGYIGDPGHIYAAAFQFRFIASPGTLPNELPLPQKVIDFAKVRVLNPPWSGGGGGGVDTNAVIDIANATISTNPVVAAKLDGPTVAPTNTAEAAGKAADAKLTGIAITNRYTKAETDAKLSPIEAQIAALQDGKRDKTDRSVYDFGDFDIVPTPGHALPASGFATSQPEWDDGGHWYWKANERLIPDIEDSEWLESDDVGEDATTIHWHVQVQEDYGVFFVSNRSVTPTGDHLATEGGVAAAIAAHHDSTKQDKITASGVLKGNGQGGVTSAEKSSTSSDPANADYRDPQDNTCHKTEVGKWIAHDVPAGTTFVHQQPVFYTSYGQEGQSWVWEDTDGSDWVASGSETAVEATFYYGGGGTGLHFSATRSAVCTSGEKFTTPGYVDGKVSDAVSTNNPAFVSAVLNTPTSGMPDDVPTDWGTYGTVGAALAALAAFVKWAKAKIVAVIGDDGKPTDDFATDLLGKPVAKAAIRNLGLKFDEEEGYWCLETEEA